MSSVSVPGVSGLDRYSLLVAKGLIRLKATTTADLDRMPSYDVSADASLLDLLLETRAEDDR